MAGKEVSKVKASNRLSRKTLTAISLVLSQISRSRIEEDIHHAFDMLQLALESPFSGDEPFVVACVSHDIERSLPCRLKPENFNSYDEFKRQHELKSASVLEKILKGLSFPRDFIKRAVFLVQNHETGKAYDCALRELLYLDVLSFFNTNSGFYLKREGEEKLLKRMIWGLKRLTPEQIERIKSEVKIHDEVIRKVFLQALDKICL